MNLPIRFSFQGYRMTNSHITSLKEVIPYRKLHKSTYDVIKEISCRSIKRFRYSILKKTQQQKMLKQVKSKV